MKASLLAKFLLAIAAIAGVSFLLSFFDDTSETWPTPTWKAAAPETGGLDTSKLATALEEARTQNPNLHAIFLVAHGKVVLDAKFYPYDGKNPHNLASVTKSVMTTLIGIAADQGMLSLDQPVLSFFPDRNIRNRDDRKERIAVRHLASMSSGLDCVGEHDEPTLHQMVTTPDWIQFTLDLKMVEEPGTSFSYCSPGMHLLSAVLQQATGQSALEFARQNLFGQLGIKEVLWPTDPQGFNRGWGDLRLYARDAAKIGYLWLHGGEWDGTQIVSRQWVEHSSSVQVTTDAYWGDNYGYGWWIPADQDVPQFAAIGRGGQRVAVFPTLDVVAVTLGGGIDSGEVLGILGGALVGPGEALSPDSEAKQKLRSALAKFTLPPEPVAVAPLPATAAKISGQAYKFERNSLMLKTVTFSFDGSSEARIKLSFFDSQPPREMPVGMDGIYRISPGENEIPAGVRAVWTDEQTLMAEYDAISSIDAFDMTFRFDGDHVKLDAKERTYEAGLTLIGISDTVRK